MFKLFCICRPHWVWILKPVLFVCKLSFGRKFGSIYFWSICFNWANKLARPLTFLIWFWFRFLSDVSYFRWVSAVVVSNRSWMNPVENNQSCIVKLFKSSMKTNRKPAGARAPRSRKLERNQQFYLMRLRSVSYYHLWFICCRFPPSRSDLSCKLFQCLCYFVLNLIFVSLVCLQSIISLLGGMWKKKKTNNKNLISGAVFFWNGTKNECLSDFSLSNTFYYRNIDSRFVSGSFMFVVIGPVCSFTKKVVFLIQCLLFSRIFKTPLTDFNESETPLAKK